MSSSTMFAIVTNNNFIIIHSEPTVEQLNKNDCWEVKQCDIEEIVNIPMEKILGQKGMHWYYKIKKITLDNDARGGGHRDHEHVWSDDNFCYVCRDKKETHH